LRAELGHLFLAYDGTFGAAHMSMCWRYGLLVTDRRGDQAHVDLAHITVKPGESA
jgi:hypothetical protein